MDILEEGLKDSIRNIVGNTLSAGISKGARTAAGGMANAGGQLYSTFVKKSTPKGARKQGNPSKPGQYGHKFGGSGGGIPGAMQAADDRKQEKFMNDPHYQLKVRLAEIKKQKLAEKKLEKQLGKAKKLQDKLRAKGVLPPELDPQLKLRLNRKPTKLLSEEEQHIDSIKNWLPNDYAGYEEYDLSDLEPEDIIESEEDEDDYTIPANRVGNGNPFKTDFNEEAISYPEPRGALARILAKSLTTGVGKAGTSLGTDLGEYAGDLSTSKDKRHDLTDSLREDVGSLRDRLKKKRLKAHGVSEESKTSELMNSILQKAIKDAISGAISTGITTAAEIGAENLGSAIGKIEKKNLARQGKDPLYQYKLTKKAALKAQKEAEIERRFLEKQATKLAKLKAKDGLAEEDINMYGKADKEGVTTADVDPFELQLGVEIEMEHTNDESVAIEIALDHLSEISDYYTRLVKMENHYKREQGIGY